ncbi:MAG: cobyrinate a,c-diamide synthase [Lachnospiraceae bacterium]|nr:cobyrinate a,c-diamide synthase [Lachnospiraceae bacterium]
MSIRKNIKVNRLMIAGMTSGSGKTTLTCAFLRCLLKRGYDLRSYKCGPDYIDPMFHKKAFGIDSRNLDIFFMGEDLLKRNVAKAENAYAVMEGAMGIYDGNDPSSSAGSCYEIAAITSTPIVLVVNAGKVGRTIISMIKGVVGDDDRRLIKGIILNNISERFYEMLFPELEEALSESRPDIKLLGFFPKTKGIDFESRHLGLKLPGESGDTSDKIETASMVFDEHIDVAEMISIMEGARELEISERPGNTLQNMGEGLTLAVALDDAFCFYYPDNIEMFEERGVKIKYFSPLNDSKVPDDADGILLGGGYPELYLDKLSANKEMLASIRSFIDRKKPSLAECGGFMYLGKSIEDDKGCVYEMAGAYDGECRFTGRLVRFGYMHITGADKSDFFYGNVNGLKGHEFHYYDSSMNGECCTAKKPFRETQWQCMINQNNGIWGFPHFYYASNPAFVDGFIGRMKEVRDGKFK